MKLKLFIMLPLFIILQGGGCSSDDDSGSINDNFVTFLGVTNEASGGCNIETTTGDFFCSYTGGYLNDGLSYTISVSHTGLCSTSTYNLRDNLDSPSNALFFIQIASNGVATDTYIGHSGSIDLGDFGVSSSMDFSGTVIHTQTGEEETISGFMECPL